MKFISLVLLITLVMLQYRLWIGHGSLTYVHHLEAEKEAQIRENQSLLDRNLSLSAEVKDLKHGYSAIEERARSEMGMIKNDETFYQVVRQPQHQPE
ncbi:MAG: cell division protein FtsB [Gammaproteobacteria bacterium]|nr:cell division protein FtsB [Gammaproteobacteria bacterium]NIN61391.1 cell division protein FtsB [Gammaproteobacteria bacterium]NIO61158.1 cell division protein FtsB [Gammaproteobacteria bacterium]NIP48908.1 cell division protein FtsB [Gammaproteobacteria bacterium]NIQ09362.1 cell division protein FtsB [Gammaproteobacteria bacterium]